MSASTCCVGVTAANELPSYTCMLSLLLSYHKSPSARDEPSALCVGALLDIWYKSAKLFISATLAPALTMLVMFWATVLTWVAIGTNLWKV